MSFSVITGGTCGSNPSIHEGRPHLTTSFGITHGTDGIIIDNGSGVQNVVRYLQKNNVERVFMLQSHLHADHTDGLPQNSYLFQNKVKVQGIWAPVCEGADFVTVWGQRFAPHIWPVRPETFGIGMPTLYPLTANLENSQFLPLGITAIRLNHPGGAVAYRIPHKRGDIVIATDHEPTKETNESYASFVSGARLLIADLQYRDSEYQGEVGIGGGPAMKRVGWGHATPKLLAAALAGCQPLPKEICITHHDPNRSAGDLDDFSGEVFKSFDGLGINVTSFADDGEIDEL
mgnify:CR=1 FL=1